MSTIRNRVIVVGAAGIAAVAFTTGGFTTSEGLSKQLWELAHVTSFSVWFGSSIWVTFVSGIVLFNTLPRHTFGLAQSRLFPKFFQLSALSLGAASLICYRLHALTPAHVSTLVAANVTVLLNLFYFEPATTAVMFKRHAVEREFGEGQDVGTIALKSDAAKSDSRLKELSRRFGLLHAGSSICNLASVCCGVFHLWYLAGRLAN